MSLVRAGLTLVVAGLLAPRALPAACINAALLQAIRSMGQTPIDNGEFSSSGPLTGCSRPFPAQDHTWTFLPARVGANPRDAAAWRLGLVNDLSTHPDDYFAKKALGDDYLDTGNLPLALQTYRTIADARTLFLLGQWAYQAGDLRRAEGYSHLAVMLSPDWAEAWYQLAEAQFATNNPSGLDSYREVLKWRPTPELAAKVHVRIGSLLAHDGDVAAAQAQFQIALELEPSNWSAMEQIGRLFLAGGETAEACHWAQRANAIASDSVWVVRLLADIRKVASCEP